MEALPDRIREAVESWPHWSRAERAKMGAIVAEVVAHAADGTGVPFVARLWVDYVAPLVMDDDTGHECPWCYAIVPALVSLWDPETLACDSVCPSCDSAYWSAPLVVDESGTASRADRQA